MYSTVSYSNLTITNKVMWTQLRFKIQRLVKQDNISVSRSLFSSSRLNSANILCTSKVIEVVGTDTVKFLQGLCTNQITQLTTDGDSIAAAFLTPKGRILTDAILYYSHRQPADLPSVLIEVDQANANDFKRYLTMYKLKSKVSIKIPQYTVSLNKDSLTNASASEINKTEKVIVASLDPRAPNIGTRVISMADGVSDESEKLNQSQHLLVHYLLDGIVEGKCLQNRIPLECNLDLLNYISFNKGCYIGQELTARTKFKGLVRKRLIPFLVSNEINIPATGKTSAFDLLEQSVRNLVYDSIITSDEGAKSPCAVEVGMKVFKKRSGNDDSSNHNVQLYVEKEQAVGEIIAVDRTGRIGMAMLQLDTVFSYDQGNFVVVHAPTTASQEESPGAASTKVSNKLNYIATFKPTWFHGLDEKTNLQIST